MHDLSIV
ncbi:hypothetical protein Xen7305DRAFT_00051440 [Xenococcus sp. PCC 7305]|nr:hypothetical protein Xen7305DRAFT_00051440 [Xenococcus sp. PCC 7305]